MRLLIFLLALTSAFFVSAQTYDPSDLVDPYKEPVTTYDCTIGSNNYPSATGLQDCYQSNIDSFLSLYPSPSECPSAYVLEESYSTNVVNFQFQVFIYTYKCFSSGIQANAIISNPTTSDGESCPPPSSPEYNMDVNIDGKLMCAKKADSCPAGYHSAAVSKALGSSECLPKECPPAGSGESLYTSPNLGTAFSGGGMYCNDGCAYSVSASNITSDKHATGTSQGVACGDKPYDNKKLADESDSDKCSLATNGDVTILSCSEANPTTPEKDPHNNDDSKTPEDETPEKPKETCADGDTACNLKNVETEIENSTNKQIDNDNQLHNKKIDADTKNTNALLNVLESIDTSIFLQTQQDDRLHAVTNRGQDRHRNRSRRRQARAMHRRGRARMQRRFP